jgi:glycosyltransferase involved in cell wall biosynthesis
VIVLARDEAERIDRCLEAILGQSHPPDRIVVVDHGSCDGTPQRVRAWRDQRILLVTADARSGIAAARNAGVAAAEADMVFFSDADCVPHRCWLAEGLAALGDRSLAGVEGVTYYEASTPPTISDSNTHQFSAGGYMTCNIAYRKAVLVAAGGFDPRFRYGHEDRELAFRIRSLGEIAFNPAMVVAHQRKLHTARGLLRLACRAQDLVLFFKLHGRQTPCRGRVLYPGRLLTLFFPPLILLKESIRSGRDLGIAAIFYLYVVLERFYIWKAALQRRIFII